MAERAEAQAKKAIAAAEAEVKEAVEKARSYEAALAQAEQKLNKAQEQAKTEALARAKAEEDLKARSEERQGLDAQVKEEIAAAKAQAEEKLRSYAAALAQAEEKLTKAKEQARTEAIARAKAEEALLVSEKADATALKAKSKERESLEAQAKEEIAAAKAQAEEKIRSYEAALSQAEEKLSKAKEQARIEAIARAKAEEALLISAKAEAPAGKVESKEPKSLDAKPPQKIKTFKLLRRHLFHLKTAKRKFALFLLVAILFVIALTFGVSVVNDPPVANDDTATTDEEKPVLITLTGSDPDGEQLTYNIVTGPSHGTLSETEPNLIYTPNPNFNGSDSFTFKVNDSAADSVPATVSIMVSPVNDPPVANPQSETTKENKSVSAVLTGSDMDSDPLMFIICKKPEHGTLTLDSNFNKNGMLSYTPKPYFTGLDTFTFKLNDRKADSTPVTVSINVVPNLLPVAEPHSVTTVEDTPVEIRLLGSDPDSDPLAYSMVTDPSHGSLVGIAPNLTYTPNTNFNGSDSFTFKVNDSAADSAPATVSIMVSPVNDPPVANEHRRR
jgi:hypothetical protein